MLAATWVDGGVAFWTLCGVSGGCEWAVTEGRTGTSGGGSGQCRLALGCRQLNRTYELSAGGMFELEAQSVPAAPDGVVKLGQLVRYSVGNVGSGRCSGIGA